jgi:hypothetical protein
MPNNDLINIANVLSEKLNSNAPTSLADMVVDNGQKKQLNYEIMFQLLMGECEKHILENVGNPIVDEFKDNILKKFSTLVQAIHNTDSLTLTNGVLTDAIGVSSLYLLQGSYHLQKSFLKLQVSGFALLG